MKSRIVLGVLVFFVLFLICFLPTFAYYSFLSPESNEALEGLKEKYRVKEIVLEKEKGIVWTVILAKNNGVEIREVKEKVYNEEGKLEGAYNFTDIVIIDAEGWTRIIWGSAADVYPYYVPRLHFVFDS